LRSIRAQRPIDLEVIIVDDGSTDDTATVAAADDSRHVVLRNAKPAGVSAARNRGIGAARGDWVAFCDDDDIWAPEKLASQLTAVERAAADWVYTGDVNVDDGLHVLSGGPPPSPEEVQTMMPQSNPLSSGGSNVLVRSKVLTAVGGFDSKLRRTEDWDLWIRLARNGPPACVAEPMVAYRFHAGNITMNPQEMVDEARRLAARYQIPVDMAAMNRRAAWAALRAGRRATALQYYGRAISHGDVRSIGRAAVAMVHPAVGSNRLFALLSRDPDWIARAERWLNTFAAGLTAPSSSE
jgi:GT2 family glycosyltransferase